MIRAGTSGRYTIDACRLGVAPPATESPRNGNEDARVQNSLDAIEEELARTERKIAALRETLKRSHGESAAHDAALRQMGIRAKEIMSRPKTWRGGGEGLGRARRPNPPCVERGG